jgi:hypothetical protein
MPRGRPFSLATLRDIGWAEWDPIGLGGPAAGWPADEYDGYLLEAATRFQSGEALATVAGFLAAIEAGHMGMDRPDAGERALRTAGAIRDYLAGLQPGR